MMNRVFLILGSRRIWILRKAKLANRSRAGPVLVIMWPKIPLQKFNLWELIRCRFPRMVPLGWTRSYPVPVFWMLVLELILLIWTICS